MKTTPVHPVATCPCNKGLDPSYCTCGGVLGEAARAERPAAPGLRPGFAGVSAGPVEPEKGEVFPADVSHWYGIPEGATLVSGSLRVPLASEKTRLGAWCRSRSGSGCLVRYKVGKASGIPAMTVGRYGHGVAWDVMGLRSRRGPAGRVPVDGAVDAALLEAARQANAAARAEGYTWEDGDEMPDPALLIEPPRFLSLDDARAARAFPSTCPICGEAVTVDKTTAACAQKHAVPSVHDLYEAFAAVRRNRARDGVPEVRNFGDKLLGSFTLGSRGAALPVAEPVASMRARRIVASSRSTITRLDATFEPFAGVNGLHVVHLVAEIGADDAADLEREVGDAGGCGDRLIAEAARILTREREPLKVVEALDALAKKAAPGSVEPGFNTDPPSVDDLVMTFQVARIDTAPSKILSAALTPKETPTR